MKSKVKDHCDHCHSTTHVQAGKMGLQQSLKIAGEEEAMHGRPRLQTNEKLGFYVAKHKHRG